MSNSRKSNEVARCSKITVERARELVKTMYAINYTKPGHTKPSKVMLRMDDEQKELVDIVSKWVNRVLGNALRKQGLI